MAGTTPPSRSAPSSQNHRYTRGRRGESRHGLTLVEVMVAFAIMVMLLLALLGAILQAYRINEEARRRDQVRAILQSFVNDFACGTVRANDGTTNALFTTSAAATGVGLSWTSSSGTTTVGTASGLSIRLGGDPQGPEVVITRHVREVDESLSTGQPNMDPILESSIGREIVGEFTAVYTVQGHRKTVSLTIVRADT